MDLNNNNILINSPTIRSVFMCVQRRNIKHCRLTQHACVSSERTVEAEVIYGAYSHCTSKTQEELSWRSECASDLACHCAVNTMIQKTPHDPLQLRNQS